MAEPLRRRSRQLTIAAMLLAVIAVINALFVYSEMKKIENDAEVINYTGIIRGSIQRITKLELAGTNADRHIEEINKIIKDVGKGDKRQDIFTENRRYRGLEKELKWKWDLLRKEILAYRRSGADGDRRKVLDISEQCWETANRLVFEAQFISEEKLVFLRYVFIIIGFNIISAAFIMFLIRRYVKNELEYFASYDPLTSALNRHSYSVILRQNINWLKRHHSDLSLLLFDIDNFKPINDRFGHDTGDYVIKTISGIVSGNLRGSDAFCRIGGEEFAIIAAETKLAQARDIAEKIRLLVSNYEFDKAGHLSVSVGIAQYRENETAESFFKRADTALYKAKKGGRDRVETAA